VPGPVLAAGDDGLANRPCGQACFFVAVACDPLRGQRFEVRAEDFRVDRVLRLGPDAPGATRLEVGQERLDDKLMHADKLVGDRYHGPPLQQQVVPPIDESRGRQHAELVRQGGRGPAEQAPDLGDEGRA
jgi:hypothetical protein